MANRAGPRYAPHLTPVQYPNIKPLIHTTESFLRPRCPINDRRMPPSSSLQNTPVLRWSGNATWATFFRVTEWRQSISEISFVQKKFLRLLETFRPAVRGACDGRKSLRSGELCLSVFADRADSIQIASISCDRFYVLPCTVDCQRRRLTPS